MYDVSSQDAFDVHGRFWWILWLAPTLRVRSGNGVVSPAKPGSEQGAMLNDMQIMEARERFMHQML